MRGKGRKKGRENKSEKKVERERESEQNNETRKEIKANNRQSEVDRTKINRKLQVVGKTDQKEREREKSLMEILRERKA